MATRWTKEQAQAIEARGEDVLVAAAAGSGKTAVLVERIIQMISNPEEERNIDELLVVTFTKAAASEMRQRLSARLESAVSDLRRQEADLAYGEKLEADQIQALAKLEQQLVLINRAQITTLHSFCTEVMRSFYYLIDIDPKVRVAEETENIILRQEALDIVLEYYYGSDDLGEEERRLFYQLVEIYGSDRDDLGLQKLILDLDTFAYAQAEPKGWLESLADSYKLDATSDLDDLDWIRDFKPQVKIWLQGLVAKSDQAIALAKESYGPGHYLPYLETERELLLAGVAAADSSWAALSKAIRAIDFQTIKGRGGKDVDPDVRDQAKGLRDLIKKEIIDIREKFFNVEAQDYLADIKEMEPFVRTLVQVSLDFRREYQRLKADKGLVDFSDLEHFALTILNTEREGVYQARDHYRASFREVLVDEYQDTNLVQEAIVQALKSEDNNIFMVGDVKQSIYRFRLAEPSLFMQKYSDFENPGQGQTGRKIDLAKNFRSRAPILHATNFIFGQIMDEKLGEIAYDDRAALVPGSDAYEANPATDQVEVILIDQENLATPKLLTDLGIRASVEPLPAETEETENSELNQEVYNDLDVESKGQPQSEKTNKADGGIEEETDADEDSPEDLDRAQLEGRVIAREIKKLIGSAGQPGFQVQAKPSGSGGQTSRPIHYRDIVILLRSAAGYSDTILEELKEAGIPAYADGKTGYFQKVEVKVMMALLKIIDNPYQDIELAAVLRSPIVGLDTNELAQIRLARQYGSYYQALQKILGRGPWNPDRRQAEIESEITEEEREKENEKELEKEGQVEIEMSEDSLAKLARFYDFLQAWRDQARQGSLSDLIWQLYRDTGYYDFVGGLDSGNQRQANLRALYDRARAYEETSYRGLFRFLRFIENIQERGQDLATARALSEQEDVVRLMTIHSSKGLEFPVVFIAGLNKQFNRMDLRGKYLLHKNMGLGVSYVNPDTRHEYPLLLKEIMKEKIAAEQLAEEMRVLYVAMTRPKEKLYLLAGIKDLERNLTSWQSEAAVKGGLLSDLWRSKSRGFVDWIMPAILGHRDLNLSHQNLAYDASGWKLEIIRAEDLTSLSSQADYDLSDRLENLAARQIISSENISSGNNSSAKIEKQEDLDIKQKIHDRLSWVYPLQEATRLASEQSVTSLKAKADQERQAQREARGEQMEGKPSWSRISAKPKFVSSQDQIAANEYGTLIHLVLEHLDLGQDINSETMKDLVQYLLTNEFMSEGEAQTLDLEPLIAFYQTELGRRIQRAYKLDDGVTYLVDRELPFVMGLPVQEVMAHSQLEDKVLVQGVIDMVFRDEEGLVLVDYKTDRTQGLTDAELLDRYQVQLDLYARAIESIWQEEVSQIYLSFLDGPRIIETNKYARKDLRIDEK